MTIRVLDIETTGIDPATDAIIEIASVDILPTLDGHTIRNEQQTLVFPGRKIPPEASAVHHIIDEDVAGAMRADQAIEMFKTDGAYVAHNCAFERSFLDTLLGDATWICTFKCALRVWPDAPGHSNQTLRYWLGLVEPFGRRRLTLPTHRALADAIVTAAVLGELMKAASWADLRQWSTEPAQFTRLTFGKHRGMKYADAPEDYLAWIVAKSDLDADTKHSARTELQRRRGA